MEQRVCRNGKERVGDGEGVFDKRFVAHGRVTAFLLTLQAEIFFYLFSFLFFIIFLFFSPPPSLSLLLSFFLRKSGLDDFVS